MVVTNFLDIIIIFLSQLSTEIETEKIDSIKLKIKRVLNYYQSATAILLSKIIAKKVKTLKFV